MVFPKDTSGAVALLHWRPNGIDSGLPGAKEASLFFGTDFLIGS
jgi:hypothetical protein